MIFSRQLEYIYASVLVARDQTKPDRSCWTVQASETAQGNVTGAVQTDPRGAWEVYIQFCTGKFLT